MGSKHQSNGIINKQEKSPETLRLIARRKEITKPGNLRFKFDSSLSRKVWVPRRPNKRGRDEVAEIDLELLFRNNEKNRWGGGYFEFNELKPSSSKGKPNTSEQYTTEPEPISSTEENEVAKSSSDIPIADLKDYDIAEKTIHYIQINHVIDIPKTKSAEAAENFKKAEFNFMIDLKTLKHKTSVDPKLLQLKICVRNKQKDRAPEEFSSVFSEITERFGVIRRGQDRDSR